jgi:hypothetical protein
LRAEDNRSSPRSFWFSDGEALLQLALHMGNHLIGSVERASRAAMLDVFIGFRQASVDDPAPGRCVFVISSGELGTVNHQLRGDDDLAGGKK